MKPTTINDGTSARATVSHKLERQTVTPPSRLRAIVVQTIADRNRCN